MVAFDDDFLSEEHLDNIDNDNEGDDGVDEAPVIVKYYSLLLVQTTTWQLRKLKFDAIQIV